MFDREGCENIALESEGKGRKERKRERSDIESKVFEIL